MYTVIGLPMTRTLRVLWALEEMGEPYEVKPHLPGSDEVKQISGLGKVPVLIDGDLVLRDSMAILAHLGDKHGRIFAAPGSAERALQNAMCQRILDEMDALLWTKSRHSFILPEDKRVPAIGEALAWEFAFNVDRLMAETETPFLVGETFSAADILFTHCIGWAKRANFMIENRQALDHAKAMRARPAFHRVAELAK